MSLTLDGGLFQKCVPPMVAETSFQKIGTGFKQRQFVFNISESIVHASPCIINMASDHYAHV